MVSHLFDSACAGALVLRTRATAVQGASKHRTATGDEAHQPEEPRRRQVRTGLRQLAALLMGASLFVGIDSGVMHLASASDIPVVALFGPTDPFYVGPRNERSVVVSQPMECMPCYLKKTCEDVRCMRELSGEKVLEACIGLLEAGTETSGNKI